MLGLPASVSACLFDLDGVLTDTARIHAAAWEEIFDDFLARHGERPFDAVRDYDEYVDGRPRLDGVRSFLASRSITLPRAARTIRRAPRRSRRLRRARTIVSSR